MKTNKIYWFLLFFSVTFISCNEELSDEEITSQLKKCGEDIPYVTITENGNSLNFYGEIHAQVMEGVDHIEVFSDQPAFGRVGSYTESFPVYSYTNERVLVLNDSVSVWRLPFIVNQTNIDYEFTLTYYCDSEGNPNTGFSTTLNFQPGDLCGSGGVTEFSPHYFINAEYPLIDDEWQISTVSSVTFNIKFGTRIPEGGTGVGLLLFPIESIDSARVEINNNSNERRGTSFHLEWVTERLEDESGDIHYGDEAYLSANINLESLISELSTEEIAGYQQIYFYIYRCGGVKFTSWKELSL